jgi:hypothetical protein
VVRFLWLFSEVNKRPTVVSVSGADAEMVFHFDRSRSDEVGRG